MPWHPPIPVGKLYSEPALQLGPGLALLLWCYDNVQRDRSVEVDLQRVAQSIGKPYGTIRDWWGKLRDGPFFCEQLDRGKRGWVVRMADDWIDWRVMANNYPVNADMSALNERSERRDVSVDGRESAVNAPSKRGERRDVSVDDRMYKEDQHVQKTDLSNNGGGMQTRARANGNQQVPPPPPPPGRADQELPSGIAQSAAEWLNHPLKTAERRQLLTLLGAYGADWLDAGIAASVAQGGRSLNYLTALLEGCRRDDRPPGSPKTHEQRNGTHHNAIGNRQPARSHAERARWSETDLDQPL